MSSHQFRWAKGRDGQDSDVIVLGPMGAYVATVTGASEEFRAHLIEAINPATVWTVTSEHGKDPGRHFRVFGTKDAADAHAAAEVNSMFVDIRDDFDDFGADATADDWAERFKVEITDRLDSGSTDGLDADWYDAFISVEPVTVG